MTQLFNGDLSMSSAVLLVLALGLAFSFEIVNGFHDTANAVATVIYTNTLRPTYAVIWSGLFNLLGVLVSTGAVAYGIVALLPVELVLNVGSGAGFAMVFALLVSAIVWNLGTWYFGLPASSSHTLIGAIMGVGLANSMISRHVFGEGVNWAKVQDAGAALLFSPLIGFTVSALLLIVAKVLVQRPELYAPPEPGKAPPLWIRGLLMLTCTGVSFAHGSNDGQKGMGLVMLILIGVVPSVYALDGSVGKPALAAIVSAGTAANAVVAKYVKSDPVDTNAAGDVLSAYLKTSGSASEETFAALAAKNDELTKLLGGVSSISELPKEQRGTVRSDIYLVSGTIAKLAKQRKIDAADAGQLAKYGKQIDALTKYIPAWVKVLIALCLGIGTMIGWKRIVVTVGERIGKAHLTYGQGAAAELVAMGTIQAADMFGLPVSTTHILSSGVAGTMAANKSGLQAVTLRNIALAWVLTVPVCVFLGAFLFAFGLRLVSGLTGHAF